jgi:hypothetical protein
MVWFQVNIPLVAGCLLMAALMDLRFFKRCSLVASILFTFLAVGAMVFGSRLAIIPANAVAVLSVMVWLGCVASMMRRRFGSKRPQEQFGSKADLTGTGEAVLCGGAWMLDPATERLQRQIASEFHLNRPLLDSSGSTLYGVGLGEAGWNGRVQLFRFDEWDGSVLQTRTFEAGILQTAIRHLLQIPTGDVSMAPTQQDGAFEADLA